MRSAILAFLFLGVVLVRAQEVAPTIPPPERFMAEYARILLAHDREGLIRLYSPRGSLALADDGADDFLSLEQIAELYRNHWQGPTAFTWENLRYERLHPEVVVVNGGFKWTNAQFPEGASFRYSGILVFEEDKWRIRSEAEFLGGEPGAASGNLAEKADTPRPPDPRDEFPLPKLGEEVPLSKIKEICAHYGLHALWAKIEKDPPPRPFKSDGCTGWFDDWKGVSLYPAGFLHDLKYWAGYPGEDVERLIADAELMTDVARLLKSTLMAETMFRGVRLGGAEQLQASFSWGFGRQPAK